MPTLLNKGALGYPTGLDDELPISYIMKHIGQCLNKSQTTINDRILFLEAKTASGKSTIVPPILYTDFTLGLYKYLPRDVPVTRGDARKIMCTQPRIITTQSVPRSIAEGAYYHQFKMGYDIGFQTSPATERTIRQGLMFAVLQVFTNQIKIWPAEKIMSTYKFIVIDEAHVRSVDLDITLFEIKKFLKKNADNAHCPYFIIMSATFDPVKYAHYFEADPDKTRILVNGFSFPVETRWPKTDYDTFVDGAVKVVGEIIAEDKERIASGKIPKDGPLGDVLIFVSGAAASRKIIKGIKGDCDREKFMLLDIQREAIINENKDYRLVMMPFANLPGRPRRRVIVATDVAETGLTLAGLYYVIDCGWANVSEYNPWYNIKTLVNKPCSRSMIHQRRGRVGRERDGVFYPLYTEKTYEMLVDIQYPAIIAEDPTPVILSVIAGCPEGESCPVNKLDLLDNPGSVAIHRAYYKLCALGFIEQVTEGESLFRATKLGRVAAKLVAQIPIEDIRMIMSGFAWDISIMDLITIAAFNTTDRSRYMTNPDNKFERGLPYESYQELVNLAFDIAPNKTLNSFQFYKIYFCDQFIDNVIIYAAFNRKLRKLKYDLVAFEDWCEKIGLDYDEMSRIVEVHESITDVLIQAGIDVYHCYEKGIDQVLLSMQEYKDNDVLLAYKQCIYDGYKLNIANYDGSHYSTPEGLKFDYSFYEGYDDKWKGFKEVLPVIPQRVIYQNLGLKYNAAENIYMIETGRISILDGMIFDDPYNF